MESKSNNLSSDMVFEILSRSSLKTLANCRLVSKQCNLLTYESSFLNLHSQRTQTLSGFFLQSRKYDKTVSTFVSAENPECKNISLDFLPASSVNIQASSVQGVLVCVDNETRIPRIPQYYVCKPLTKEWQLIPNPKTRFFTISMGIKVLKSNPLEYKIVRLSQPKQAFAGIFKYYCLRCEIYDSTVGKWRQTKELIKLSYDELLISSSQAISVGGRFHWLTMKKNVLAFDIDDEKYSLFPLPNSPNCDNVHVTDYEGKLSVICKGDGFFELWVMENYRSKEWKKRARVSTESLEKEKNQTFYPAAFCNGDVASVPGYYSFLFFKFKNGSKVDEVRLEHDVMPQGVYPFRSDSELCNMKNELFKKHYSNSKLRKEKPKPREEEYMSSSHIQPCFRPSPTFVFLFVLFFFTLVCFILDF